MHESESESEVAQSCPTLSDPMDCSLPGSSVHGILQARVLEWVPSPSPGEHAGVPCALRCVPVSHVGNSCNISDFGMIIFVKVICDFTFVIVLGATNMPM